MHHTTIQRRTLWTCVAVAAIAVGSFELGTRVATTTPISPTESTVTRAQLLDAAIERYRADHGWYPCDSERDYNNTGREDLLHRQLTEFTRDDGKPSATADGEYRFGPYLSEIPPDPVTGSRRIVIDATRARTWRRLNAEVAADNGAGGWYYEVRTGSVLSNRGRGRAPRLATTL